MADAPEEAADITTICGGLLLNIGTLNRHSVESMHLAGKKAKKLGHVIVLDPVGAGASAFRTQTARSLLEQVKPTVIRGNVSEIKALILGSGTTKGVDADAADKVTEENLENMISFAKQVSLQTGAILAMTGEIDLVSDSNVCYVIRNGRPEMSKITGTGCQLSGIVTAYAIANPHSRTEAVAAAVCLMGLAGEIGVSHLSKEEGNSSLRDRILDAVCHIDAQMLEEGAKYEIR